jgi:hypothetical protein
MGYKYIVGIRRLVVLENRMRKNFGIARLNLNIAFNFCFLQIARQNKLLQ